MRDAASVERMALDQEQRIAEVVKREQSRLRNFIRRWGALQRGGVIGEGDRHGGDGAGGP